MNTYSSRMCFLFVLEHSILLFNLMSSFSHSWGFT